MNPQIRRVLHRGRAFHQFPGGRLLPIIRGGDGPDAPPALTLQDLNDDRGRVLAVLDEITETVRSRPEGERVMTAEERERYDLHAWRFDELGHEIARAEAHQADADRLASHEVRRSLNVPNVNRISTDAPVSASRSLDELLWATRSEVPAGEVNRFGQVVRSGAMNPVEQVVIRADGDGPVYAPRIDEILPQHHGVVRSFQQTVADMATFGLLIDTSARTSAEGFQVARSHRLFKDRWSSICRAMDVDTSGEGGTWVPTGIGATLHEKVRAMGKVAALFTRIDLPTNPWKWPIEGADATAYRVAEPTGDTATKVTVSTPGTVAATFDAEIFGGRVLFSRSLEADSAMAIAPYVQAKLVRAFAIAEERAVLDGDTDGTHQDTDIGSSTTDAATAWDGLRKKGLAETSTATTTSTSANLATIRKAMKKWGVNPADLAFIVGVSSYGVLLSDTNLVTVDKFGPSATILNGQIGAIYGVPVIVSEYVREDLNASGVNDAITTTKTYMLCVNRNEWAFGQRMALDIQTDDSIYRETYQRVMVGFMREDFQNIGDASTNEDTSIGYNVTSGS